MSNLKLQDTNYTELLHRLTNRRGKSIKVGNNTEAILWNNGVIVIQYHGNTIARMDADSIRFSNAGWGTATTRTRLNIIADHNNVPVVFNQHDHKQILRARKRMWNGGEWSTLTENFTTAIWDRDNDVVHVAEVGYLL